MIFIYIVPVQALSLNQAYSGKKYKSDKFNEFEQAVTAYLYSIKLPRVRKGDPIYLYFEFGLPTRQDVSNSIKIFEDLLFKFIGSDDRYVMAIHSKKITVKKDDCYIKFDIFMTEHELIEQITNAEIN